MAERVWGNNPQLSRPFCLKCIVMILPRPVVLEKKKFECGLLFLLQLQRSKLSLQVRTHHIHLCSSCSIQKLPKVMAEKSII